MAVAPRHPGLESGRVLSAVGIIWLHTAGIGPNVAPLGTLGRFAVPFFTLIAVIFLVHRFDKSASDGFTKFLKNRLLKLYLPFIVFSVVYYALRWAKTQIDPAALKPPIGLHLLFVGTAHHLWYLPFLCLLTIGLRICMKLIFRSRTLSSLLGLLLGLIVSQLELKLDHNPNDPDFINQVNYLIILGFAALPGALWGVAIGINYESIANRLSNRLLLSMLAVLAAFFLIGLGQDYPMRILRENLSGLLIFIACMSMPEKSWLRHVGRFGEFTFAIYLVHVMWILAFEKVLLPDRSAYSLNQALTIFALSTLASWVSAWILVRLRLFS